MYHTIIGVNFVCVFLTKDLIKAQIRNEFDNTKILVNISI